MINFKLKIEYRQNMFLHFLTMYLFFLEHWLFENEQDLYSFGENSI